MAAIRTYLCLSPTCECLHHPVVAALTDDIWQLHQGPPGCRWSEISEIWLVTARPVILVGLAFLLPNTSCYRWRSDLWRYHQNVLVSLLPPPTARQHPFWRQRHHHAPNSQRPSNRVRTPLPCPYPCICMLWPRFYLEQVMSTASISTVLVCRMSHKGNTLTRRLRDEPVDIYYTWQRLPLPLSHSAHSTSASSSHSHPAEMYPTSNPVLLTRWDPPMSTYKPLTLPIPPLAKSGESWRLSLFVQSDTPSTGSISKPGFPTRSGFVPGSDHRLGPSNRAEKLLELGCPVLGVWSEGIRITPSSSSRVAPAEVGSVGSRSTVVGGAGGGSKKAGHTHGPDPGGGRNKKGQYKDDGKGKGKGKGGGGEGESVPKQSRITREFSWTLPLSGSTPSHGATTPSPAPHSSCTHSTLHPHAQRPVPVRQILRIIEQTSFDLDKKIWDSGLALGAWLWRDIVTPSAQSGSERRYGQHDELVQDVLQRCQGRVVELGSGTGLVGIMLYLALRNAGRYGTQDGERGRGEIVATDLRESAFF